jgi:hypothetical protein
MAQVKRSLVQHFLNTGSILSPTWSLISAGVPEGMIAMNPNVTTETNIADDTATITVNSYAPTIAIDSSAVVGNAVYAWLDAARKGRDVLADAETELVNVWLYKPGGLTYYYAEKQPVAVQCDSFGGPGGLPLKLAYAINYRGDATMGGFSPTASAFVATPVNTVLTTMVIGSVTLAPLFATDKAWLWYAGSVSNATEEVSMASTLAGATIVQKEGLNVVNQGANAALAVGVNHLTIQVTVGTEVSTYRIDITRAAA